MTTRTAWTAGLANWRPPTGRAMLKRSSPLPAWLLSALTGQHFDSIFLSLRSVSCALFHLCILGLGQICSETL